MRGTGARGVLADVGLRERAPAAPCSLPSMFGHRISKARPAIVPSARPILGARVGLAPSATNSDEVTALPVQGQAPTCVANALALGVQVRAKILGVTIPLPSRRGIYYDALAIERRLLVPANAPPDAPLAELPNEGCDPLLAAQGVQELGCCAETLWPYDETKPTEQPPFDVFEAMGTFTLRQLAQIDSVGQERVADVQQALASGFPVPTGIQCDTAWMDYEAGDPPLLACDPKDQQGGHMVLLLDYGPEGQLIPREQWTTSDGSGVVFKGANWWDRQWGYGGWFFARPEWLMAQTTSDVLLVDAYAGESVAHRDARLGGHSVAEQKRLGYVPPKGAAK
jgi:hypothetical protein